jgi:hypothetical protein
MVLGAGVDGEMAGGNGRTWGKPRGGLVDLVDTNSRPVDGGSPDDRASRFQMKNIE